MDRDQLTVVLKWKLEARWLPGTFKRLALELDERIEGLTCRAFACNDELGALLILEQLNGIGAPVASAILLAHDQDRYTVLDVWAMKSLCWLGLLPDGSEAGTAIWPDYLAACRGIAERTGEALRTVDRALYKGRGNPIREEQ